jgi:hypothetical protein
VLECPADPFFCCPSGPRACRRCRQTVRVIEHRGTAGCGALSTRSWDRCVYTFTSPTMFVRECKSRLWSSRVSSSLLPSRKWSWLVLCSCVGIFVFSMLRTHQRKLDVVRPGSVVRFHKQLLVSLPQTFCIMRQNVQRLYGIHTHERSTGQWTAWYKACQIWEW